jgi:hypothetical protein
MKYRMILLINCFICVQGFSLSTGKNVKIYSSVLNRGSVKTNPALVSSWKHTTANAGYILGATYSKPIGSNVSINTGLEFSDHKMITTETQSLPLFTIVDPAKGNIQFLSGSVNIRLAFLKYFYETAGSKTDFQIKNTVASKQSGIGITGAGGCKYPVFKGVSFFAQPFYQLHGVIFYSKSETKDKVYNAGLRFGLALHLI